MGGPMGVQGISWGETQRKADRALVNEHGKVEFVFVRDNPLLSESSPIASDPMGLFVGGLSPFRRPPPKRSRRPGGPAGGRLPDVA